LSTLEEIVSGEALIRADSIFAKNASGRHLLEILPSKRPAQQAVEVTQGMGIRRWTMTDAKIGGDPQWARRRCRRAGRALRFLGALRAYGT
jgi:hypothetical protein